MEQKGRKRKKTGRRKEEKGRAAGPPGRPSQEEKEEKGAGLDPEVGLKMKKGNFFSKSNSFLILFFNSKPNSNRI